MQSISHQTIKNSIYGFIGFVWPVLLAFVATPILIKYLGLNEYGYYILLNAGIAFFSILDFGLSYTFIKKISEEPDNAGTDYVSKLFSSTFWAYAIIGLLVFILLNLIPNIFKTRFHIPDGFVYSEYLIFFCLGLTFLFKMLTVTISQIPYALHRLDLHAKVTLINITLVQISSIIAVIWGFGITALVAIQLAAAILLFIIYFVISKRMIPNLRLGFHFSSFFLKGIAKDGFWIFISNGTGNLLSQLDKFVVGIFCGSAGVTYYASSQMISEKINSVAFSFSASFFPVFSRASILGANDRVRSIFRRGLSMIAFIVGGLAITVLIYNYQLLEYWLGKDIANNAHKAVFFLVGTYFLMSLSTFTSFFLSGWRKLKFTAFTVTIMALLDIFFMFILIPKFGVTGAAMAYLISVLPIPLFILYIEIKYLSSSLIDAIRFYLRRMSKILIVVFAVYFFSTILLVPIARNLGVTILLGGFSFVLYLALYWFFGFFDCKEDVECFKAFFNKILYKFNFGNE